MRYSRLASLAEKMVAMDTETWLIRPDLPAPPMVCGSLGWLEPGPRVVGALLDKYETLETFAAALEDPDAVICGANISFDLLVLANEFAKRGIDVFPEIFAALADDKIYDCQTAEALHAIAEGCLLYKSRLNCWDGSTVQIGDVVSKGLTPTLIGMNQNGELVPCTVTNRFNNGRRDNWVDLHLSTPVVRSTGSGGHSNRLRITANHEVYSISRAAFTPAGQLESGELVKHYIRQPDERVLHMVRASLLGDGSIINIGKSARYNEGHSTKQLEYVQWKHRWLGECAVKPVNSVSGKGSSMICISSITATCFETMRREWYCGPDQKKMVPDDLSWLDDFAVAIWYMDDGSLGSNNNPNTQNWARLSTNGFVQEDVNRLAKHLIERYGVQVRVHYSRGWEIRINAGRTGTIDRFWECIRPHIHPSMAYKLPERYRTGLVEQTYSGTCGKISVPSTVVAVHSVPNPSRVVGYDIETTTHNYMANGILVHNCLGKDPRTQQGLKNPETGKPGSYSLSMCVDLVLGRTDAKAADAWRLRYQELDGIPLAEWPSEARDYPIDDARNTQEVSLAQTGHLPKLSPRHNWGVVNGSSVCLDCGSTKFSSQCSLRRPHLNLHEVSNQVWSTFALKLGDAAGLWVDQSRVDIIEAHAAKRLAAGIGPFIEAGIIRKDGTEDRSVLKKMIAVAYGATGACRTCAGTGKVPSSAAKPVRCTACRGRCIPWKAGGKIKDPTVAVCDVCKNTGLIPNPNPPMINCSAQDGSKTCDGTGLILGEDVPRSDKEGIAFGRDACFESADDFLMSFGDLKEDQKIPNYIAFLRKARLCTGCNHIGDEDDPHVEDCLKPGWRDIKLTLSSNAILETGRVSYRGLIQTFPRAPGYVDKPTGQYIPSLRECFIAQRPQYETIEVPDDYVLQSGECAA